MKQILVLISEQGSCLFWLHVQRCAQSNQNHFQRAIRFSGIFAGIHGQNVNSFFDFLLRINFFPLLWDCWLIPIDFLLKIINCWKHLRNHVKITSNNQWASVFINRYAQFLWVTLNLHLTLWSASSNWTASLQECDSFLVLRGLTSSLRSSRPF